MVNLDYFHDSGKVSLLHRKYEIHHDCFGLYTGAHLNELCQLYVNNIKEIDKIWCIDINRNTNDKKLKNASSERVIPIHPKLIELGFLNFLKEQKKKNSQRLFSHLTLGSDVYIS